jgi:pilus assembly protein CpaE
MVLAAPLKIEYADFISAEHVHKILKILSQDFDYIIVDCASYMHDPILVALEASDIILLVTTLDLFSIKNLKACISSLEALNFSRAKFRLVINRAFKGAGVTETDIETTLGLAVTTVLPIDDQILIKSVNQGTPAVLSYKNSGFAHGIQELVKKITDKRPHSRKSFFSQQKLSS